MTPKQRDHVKHLMALHHLALLSADLFLTSAMRKIEFSGGQFKHEKKRTLNQMLANAKALERQYTELFDFLYSLDPQGTQADFMRRDATFLARLMAKAMDKVAGDPARIETVEKAVMRLKSGDRIDLEQIDRDFIFR